MSNSALIQWLTACYREDRVRAGVRDFYSAVKYRRMTQGEEQILTGGLPEIILPPKYGSDLAAYSLMHKRERESLYGALFVCGKTGEGIHRSPLVIFNAKIEERGDEYFPLRVEMKGARLNQSALDALQAPKEFEQGLRELLVGEGLSEGMVGEIRRQIEEYCPHVNCESLLKWPYLETSGMVEDAGKSGDVCVLSAVGLANVERQVSTRGLLEELKELGGMDVSQHSDALAHALGEVSELKTAGDPEVHFIPASLSSQQERVLQSAREQALTVCHGPPGTGKSYTVAAIALDHVIRGESVLVTSRGDHAVNVLHQKIDSMLGAFHATVRAGRSEHLKNLKSLLKSILAGANEFVVEGPVSLHVLYKRIEEQVGLIREAERALEEEFEKSLERADVHLDPSPSLVRRLQSVWNGYAIKRRPLLSEMRETYIQLQQERELALRHYIKLKLQCQITKVLDDAPSRKELQKLWEGVRKRRGSDQQAILKELDYAVLLKALPVWLTSTEDMHRVLPLKKEMFDVLIIDEASQCDLASILPALQRAKRVVVVGDTKQLRHVSFLSKHAMVTAAKEFSVAEEVLEKYHYRKRSFMDVAIDLVHDQKQTGFLNEHFRSKYAIISYSNRRFYQERLQIMRERPWIRKEDEDAALKALFVDAGVRDARGVNQSEIDAVVRVLRDLLEEYPKNALPSIGVLSPFRAQVDALTRSVFDEFRGFQLRRLQGEAKLLIGTAHSFQGEERSMMLISMAIDKNYHAASLRFLEREDVFNVAITRARDRQYVFHSIDSNRLKPDSILSEYLMHIDAGSDRYTVDSAERDRFANEVVGQLCSKNDQVSVGERVAGVPIDIVIQCGDKVLAIDLIGYPGDMRAAVHAKKALMLSRAGLDLIPLGYYEWQMRRDECVVLLNSYIQQQLKEPQKAKAAIEDTRPSRVYSYVKRNDLRHFGKNL